MDLWDPYAEFETIQLSNSLSVYNLHRSNLPQSIVVVVHSAAQCDPKGCEGTAHFVEHLIGQNASLPHKELEDFFRDMGGSVNLGITSFTRATYGFFMPYDLNLLGKAFSLFGNMLLGSKLDNFFEREREVILREYGMHFNNAMRTEVVKRQRKALYREHWISRYMRPLGTEEGIRNISPQDTQSYYDTYYTPANMSIVAVGGLDMERLLRLVKDSPFAQAKSGTRTPIPPHLPSNPLVETYHTLNFSDFMQGVTTSAYESFAKLPRSVSQQGSEIFLDMLNLKLDDEMRQKRAWTYSTDVHISYVDSYNEVRIGCSSLPADSLPQVEEVVNECISSVPHDSELFEKLRRRKIVSKYVKDWTSGGISGGVIDDLTIKGRPISLAEEVAECERITLHDLSDIAELLKPSMRYTLFLQS